MHRNHCPYCLWSKHVDNRPGDRNSNCGSRMEPIGLTLKDEKENPFTGKVSGELMIIHGCFGCGKIGTNRIAGDDSCMIIEDLLRIKITRDTANKLKCLNIIKLNENAKKLVLSCLYGHDR